MWYFFTSVLFTIVFVLLLRKLRTSRTTVYHVFILVFFSRQEKLLINIISSNKLHFLKKTSHLVYYKYLQH